MKENANRNELKIVQCLIYQSKTFNRIIHLSAYVVNDVIHVNLSGRTEDKTLESLQYNFIDYVQFIEELYSDIKIKYHESVTEIFVNPDGTLVNTPFCHNVNNIKTFKDSCDQMQSLLKGIESLMTTMEDLKKIPNPYPLKDIKQASINLEQTIMWLNNAVKKITVNSF